MKKGLFLIRFLICLIWCNHVNAQITVTFPTAAADLTHGYGQSNLTVQLGFTSSCTGTSVTVALPPSVTYVPGSISQTATTISGSTITESSIANLNAPVFNLNGITGAGNITFTISRKAGCGSLASGKDTIRVTGSCGSFIENDPNTNVYNLFSPVLSLTPPTPATNVNVGDILNRSTVITNGGNGCIDTVVFYTVQSAANLQTNSVTVGGLPVSSFSSSGDTTFYKVYGSQLSGDNLLCNGESFTAVTNVTVLNCADLTSAYGAGWGTSANNICEVTTGSSMINMSTSQPLLVGTIATATALPVCANGSRTFTFAIKNTGAATAYNIVIPFMGGVGSSFTGVYYDTASLMVTLPGINGNMPYHPVAGDISVSAGSLGCANGFAKDFTFAIPSGFTLAPGDSITIVYDAVQCNSNNCDNTTNSSWNTVYWDYKDQCGNSYARGNTGVYPTMSAGFIHGVTTQAPALVFASGGCYNYSLGATFAINGSGIGTYKEIKVTVPAGTTLNSLFEESGAVPLSGYPVQIGDTIVVRYAQDPNQGTTLALKFGLCTPSGGGACGNTAISAQLRMVRDTTCANPMVATQCITNNLYYLCPGGGSCQGPGLLNFAYGRTTYGRPDNNNDGRLDTSGSVDLSKIELDRYRPGDVMKTRYVSSIDTSTANPSWAYMFSEWAFGAARWQPQGTANITIWKSGAITHALTGIPVSDISAGAGTNFKADWSSQLAVASPGFTYSPATVDSAIIEASFKFISDTLQVNSSVPNSSSSFFIGSINQPYNAITPGQLSQEVYTAQDNPATTRYSCFISRYNYYLVGEFIAAWGGPHPSGNVTGCGTLSMTYRYHNYVGGATPYRFFPFEYRPMAPADTLEFDVPAGWSITGYGMVQSLFNNPSVYSYEGYNINSYIHTTGNIATGWHVLVDFTNAYAAGAMRLASEGNVPDFVLYAKPTCAVADSVVLPWSYTAHFTDYPDTANNQKVKLTGNTLYLYNHSQKPVLTLQNNTGVVQGVQPQQYWDVQVNNTGTYAAPNLWMALEDGNTNVNIDSVVLMPSNAVLSPVAYGSGNKMYQISAAGLAGNGTNQQARVYFKYTNCAQDSIKMLVGYDCDAFPSDPAVACQSDFQYLKVIPANSQVQLSIDRQPGNGSAIDLCTTDSIVAIVNSAEAGNLIAPYVNIYPPTGATVQTPVSIEYPIGSGNFQNATVTSITGGYKIDLTAHTGIGANGLPGTILNPQVNGRQASVSIKFSTTCGITSGTSMTLSAFGNKPCGAGAKGNGTSAQTSGVNIIGATTSGSAGITIGLGATSLACGGTTTLNLSTVPVTTPTQNGDTVIYTLPAGLSYNGNFVAGANCSSCTISTSADPAGTTSVKVALQPGVAAGSTLDYTFDVIASGAGCGAMTINANAKRTIAPLICGVTPCSGSSAIIGTATSPPITLDKPNITIDNIVKLAGGNWYPGGYGSVSVAYTNTGTQAAPANTYQIEFFCGASTTPFATHTLTHALAINASGSDTFNLNIPTGICNVGDLITGKVQGVTSSSVSQCICNAQSFTMTGEPLPIHFSHSKANATHCAVSIDWGYEVSETKVSSFAVERSSNGSIWKRVATLKANVTNYEDVTPASGKWYYRIVATGSDGADVYSKTMMVTTTQCKESTIHSYPNPAQDQLHIVLQGSSVTNRYELVDALGRVLQSGDLQANNNNLVNLQGISNGVYILKVTADESVMTQQIQILR